MIQFSDHSRTRLYASFLRTRMRSGFDAEIVDSNGNKYLQLAGYRTVVLPDAMNAEPESLQAAMSLSLLRLSRCSLDFRSRSL